MRSVLWPVNTDYFLPELRQWLYWKYPGNDRAILIAQSKLVDPRLINGYPFKTYDHPEYVYSTFIPEYYAYWVKDLYSISIMKKSSKKEHMIRDAWDKLHEFADNEHLWCHETDTACSIYEIANWMEWEAKYDWFDAMHNPWRSSQKKYHDGQLFNNPWPKDFTKEQRVRILQRDQSTCQLCGAQAGHGVRLHIDHIVPKAKGGCAVPWNLWVLCDDCNLGKSDHTF